MLSPNPPERRLQFSGVLLILGLLVEGLCLFWTRPLAFVLFLSEPPDTVNSGSLLPS